MGKRNRASVSAVVTAGSNSLKITKSLKKPTDKALSVRAQRRLKKALSLDSGTAQSVSDVMHDATHTLLTPGEEEEDVDVDGLGTDSPQPTNQDFISDILSSIHTNTGDSMDEKTLSKTKSNKPAMSKKANSSADKSRKNSKVTDSKGKAKGLGLKKSGSRLKVQNGKCRQNLLSKNKSIVSSKCGSTNQSSSSLASPNVTICEVPANCQMLVGTESLPNHCSRGANSLVVPGQAMAASHLSSQIGNNLLSNHSGLMEQNFQMVQGPDGETLPIGTTPMFLPTHSSSSLNPDCASSSTTAFAQVTKIEQGREGYILHLNIPALGLTNVVLSTPGLSLAPGTDQKLLAAGANAMLPSILNMASGNPMMTGTNLPNGNFNDTMNTRGFDTLEHEEPMEDGLDSHSLGDGTAFHDTDSGHDSSPHSYVSGAQDTCTGSDLPLEEDDGHLVNMEQLALFDNSSSSSDSGCGFGSVDLLDDPVYDAHPGDMNGVEESVEASVVQWINEQEKEEFEICDEKNEDDFKEDGSAEMDESAHVENAAEYVEIAQWEKPEVEKFVICSDGPMECVLCSFKTLDYSAFKSHIICSHPCWRITKKLSKNRLLVEKAVKMNVNLTPLNNPLGAKSRKACSLKDKGSGKSERHKVNLIKVKKGHGYQRKKQMLERNKRLFRCSLCMRLFVFEGSIVNHLVDHHLVKKPYDHIQVSNNHGSTFGRIHRCAYKNCYTSCVTAEELERHRVESHAQVVYRCQICGFTADSSETVEFHAASIHNQCDLMYGPTD